MLKFILGFIVGALCGIILMTLIIGGNRSE